MQAPRGPRTTSTPELPEAADSGPVQLRSGTPPKGTRSGTPPSRSPRREVSAVVQVIAPAVTAAHSPVPGPVPGPEQPQTQQQPAQRLAQLRASTPPRSEPEPKPEPEPAHQPAQLRSATPLKGTRSSTPPSRPSGKEEEGQVEHQQTSAQPEPEPEPLDEDLQLGAELLQFGAAELHQMSPRACPSTRTQQLMEQKGLGDLLGYQPEPQLEFSPSPPVSRPCPQSSGGEPLELAKENHQTGEDAPTTATTTTTTTMTVAGRDSPPPSWPQRPPLLRETERELEDRRHRLEMLRQVSDKYPRTTLRHGACAPTCARRRCPPATDRLD
jgi:hypothetical protein